MGGRGRHREGTLEALEEQVEVGERMLCLLFGEGGGWSRVQVEGSFLWGVGRGGRGVMGPWWEEEEES